MPRIETLDGTVKVTAEPPGVFTIHLFNYAAERHQADVIRELRNIDCSKAVELSIHHIRDAKIVDEIIKLVSGVAGKSFRSVALSNSIFLPSQMHEFLTHCQGTVSFGFYGMEIHRVRGAPGEIIQYQHLNHFHIGICQTEFTRYLFQIVRIQTIYSFTLQMLYYRDKGEASEFIGSCTQIERVFTAGVDFPAMFGSPVSILDMEIDYDWLAADRALQFADTLSRLHSNGLRSFQNTYIVPGTLNFDQVSEKLKQFAVQTLNRYTYQICSFAGHPAEERLEEEQSRIAALPYGIMMILFDANKKRIGSLGLPPDLIGSLGYMLGIPRQVG